jgi:hypothetical protein
MKAIEATGTVDDQGNLALDQPVIDSTPGRVRVIILYSEKDLEEAEQNLDDTPLEEIKESLRRALQEAKSGQRIPISQMWDGIDA